MLPMVESERQEIASQSFDCLWLNAAQFQWVSSGFYSCFFYFLVLSFFADDQHQANVANFTLCSSGVSKLSSHGRGFFFFCSSTILLLFFFCSSSSSFLTVRTFSCYVVLETNVKGTRLARFCPSKLQ